MDDFLGNVVGPKIDQLREENAVLRAALGYMVECAMLDSGNGGIIHAGLKKIWDYADTNKELVSSATEWYNKQMGDMVHLRYMNKKLSKALEVSDEP